MIRIYGASDDLVEIDAGLKSDEVGAYERPVTVTVTDAAGHGARFIVEYAPEHASSGKGVWRIGVEPLEEDVPMPWPITMKLGGRGYSAVAEIDAIPEAVTITHDGAEEDDDG